MSDADQTFFAVVGVALLYLLGFTLAARHLGEGHPEFGEARIVRRAFWWPLLLGWSALGAVLPALRWLLLVLREGLLIAVGR